MLDFLKFQRPFGEVVADLYTIEFQKRGLPHCHILLWVSNSCRITNASDIDRYICAEIPNPVVNPTLHKIIIDSMIHGPCGAVRPTSPCMSDNSCSKGFPKKYEAQTRFDKNGYAHYRRQVDGHVITKNGLQVDSAYVVPYNETLSLRFNAHINVEYCGWNMMIKYLFKYISKGVDRLRFKVTTDPSGATSDSSETNIPIDEIANFVDGRYLCSHEAAWRILNFQIHERHPAVQILAVHLENMQSITFKDSHSLCSIANCNIFVPNSLYL